MLKIRITFPHVLLRVLLERAQVRLTPPSMSHKSAEPLQKTLPSPARKKEKPFECSLHSDNRNRAGLSRASLCIRVWRVVCRCATEEADGCGPMQYSRVLLRLSAPCGAVLLSCKGAERRKPEKTRALVLLDSKAKQLFCTHLEGTGKASGPWEPRTR